MKLLTFAHRGEAQSFLAAFDFKPVDFFFDGLLRSDDYFLLITGEGPQSASEKTVCVLAKFADVISHVYNIGIAGSLNPKIKLHDLIWIRTAYAHHAEKLEFKSYSSVAKSAKHDCITAFNRVLDIEEKKKISLFADIVDRELWAISGAASLFKKPISSLKIVSDEMKEVEIDICKFVKMEAPLFSQKLLAEFQREQNNLPELMTPKKESSFLNDPLFYFTTSQERKLKSLLENLNLLGNSTEDLEKLFEIKEIRELDKMPKERSRLLLQFLSDKLNPISVKIRQNLDKVLSPLHNANISVSYDNDFEDDWINLSARIQSTRDIEKIKNALKIFSYEDFKNKLNGQIDV